LRGGGQTPLTPPVKYSPSVHTTCLQAFIQLAETVIRKNKADYDRIQLSEEGSLDAMQARQRSSCCT